MSSNEKLYAILEHFLAVAPYINQFTVDDVGLCLFDREKVIWDVNPRTFHFDKETYVGEPLLPELAVYKAMQKRVRVIEEVPKEFYGWPIFVWRYRFLKTMKL